MKEFTSEELLSFNGKDGNPVYIAFEGKVYDVSKSPLWSSGLHMKRHPSGKDLSGEISAAPHGPEVLERYPQVGILKKGPPEELKHLPPILQNLIQQFPMARRHPHPMIVHFPIAFLMGASLFILLHLLFQNPSFEIASFYLLDLGSHLLSLCNGHRPFHMVGQLSTQTHSIREEKDSTLHPSPHLRDHPHHLAEFEPKNFKSHLFHPDASPHPHRHSPGLLRRPDDFPH